MLGMPFANQVEALKLKVGSCSTYHHLVQSVPMLRRGSVLIQAWGLVLSTL